MFCVVDEVSIGNQSVPDVLLLEFSCCCADFTKLVYPESGTLGTFSPSESILKEERKKRV